MSGSTQHRVVFSCRDGHTECKDVLLPTDSPSEAEVGDALFAQHDISGVTITRFYRVDLRRVLPSERTEV